MGDVFLTFWFNFKHFCEENKYTRKKNRAKEIAVLRARQFCYLIPDVNTKHEDNAQGRGFEKLGCAGYQYQ